MISPVVFHYWEALLRLIYPAMCAGCNGSLGLEEKWICSSCRLRLEQLRYSPLEASLEDPIEFIDQAWALYPYASPVQDILTRLKFHKEKWLVDLFTEDLKCLLDCLSGELSYDWIIPIPMHPFKRAQREFNQAQILARKVSSFSGIRQADSLLAKRLGARQQSSLNREDRQRNLTGSFRVLKSGSLAGKSILLVDDILTTGSTAREAAKTLKEAGASQVDLFAFARTLLHS